MRALVSLCCLFILLLQDVFYEVGRRKKGWDKVEAILLPKPVDLNQFKDLINQIIRDGHANSQHLLVILQSLFYGGGLVATVGELSSLNVIMVSAVFSIFSVCVSLIMFGLVDFSEI
jgi:hypothetical protein